MRESLYGFTQQEDFTQRVSSAAQHVDHHRISLVNSPFTIIPRSEPAHEDLSQYLASEAGYYHPSQFSVTRQELSEYDVDFISAIPLSKNHDMGITHVEFSHFAFDFIEALPPGIESARVYMTAFHDKMFIAVIKEHGVHLLNSFDYVNKEGMLYFLALTFERLHLDRGNTPVYISGAFSSDGPEVQLLRTYFGDIVLAHLVDEMEIEDAHRFYPLYAVAGCV